MARRVVAGAGRALIALGVLILLFVVYQLWGTNLSESSSQKALAHQFQHTVAQHPPAGPTSVRSTEPAGEALPGSAVAHLRIPKIGVDKFVVEGVGEADLKKGPGHYPGTPMPGEQGNVAIAGHRTTYGAPFYNLNELAAGDPVYLTTGQGTFRYLVFGTKIVAPTDVAVVADTPDAAELTLTTCNPRFSAAQRLVVFARLAGIPLASHPLGDNGAQPTAPATTAAPTNLTDGSSSAVGPTVGWGLAGIAVWVAAWAVARRFRRSRLRGYPVYAAALPVFLIFLFLFFENVSLLLPSSI